MKPNELDDNRGSVVDFRDIVDQDKNEQHSSQVFVGALIESLPFRIGILLAILMNSVVVGLQTNKYLAARYEAVFLGLDKFFYTLFAIEILIKWYHDFLGFWRVGWNIFDFFIIGTSFIVPGVRFVSGSRILHVLRVLHATRSLRSISTLRGLQIVMQTVLYSIPDVAYVMALLLICIYIFAILGNSIFGDDCPQNFGTVERTMFSLFVCITQDGWLRIKVELDECGHQIVGPIYLVVFITIGAFVFANLVVAVVVTNLELVIAEKSEVEKKLSIIKQDAAKLEEMPAIMSKYNAVFKKARSQKPLILNPKALDNYLPLIASLEENFSQFRFYKDELVKIQQEIEALERIDDEVSNDDLVDIIASAYVPKSQSHAQRRPSRINLGAGDVMTEMLGLAHKTPAVQVGHGKSIHHMITQLVREPSDHARPSLTVHSQDQDIPLSSLRRGSQYISESRRSSGMTDHLDSFQTMARPFTSAGPRRLSSAEYQHHPSSAGFRPSTAGYRHGRHLSSADHSVQRRSSYVERLSSADQYHPSVQRRSSYVEQRLSSADRHLSLAERCSSYVEHHPSHAERRSSYVEHHPSHAERRSSSAEQRLSSADRHPSHAERRSSYVEHHPSHAERRSSIAHPSHAERRSSSAEQRLSSADRHPSRAERRSSFVEQRLSSAERHPERRFSHAERHSSEQRPSEQRPSHAVRRSSEQRPSNAVRRFLEQRPSHAVQRSAEQRSSSAERSSHPARPVRHSLDQSSSSAERSSHPARPVRRSLDQSSSSAERSSHPARPVRRSLDQSSSSAERSSHPARPVRLSSAEHPARPVRHSLDQSSSSAAHAEQRSSEQHSSEQHSSAERHSDPHIAEHYRSRRHTLTVVPDIISPETPEPEPKKQ